MTTTYEITDVFAAETDGGDAVIPFEITQTNSDGMKSKGTFDFALDPIYLVEHITDNGDQKILEQCFDDIDEDRICKG